jgi:DNA-binding winged helix-turn-helix (wHTH) protein
MLFFGDVRLDPAARQIWRGTTEVTTEVHLTPKAFDLLVLLLERRPQVVSKQEIRQQLWPDTFVSETNLPALMTEIRKILGDDAREPRFVRTSHKLGYAFCGAVDVGPAAETESKIARWWLVGLGEQIPLYDGENVLGREGDGITVIRSATVSRRHARIDVGADQIAIEDLGSKNGTFVEDTPVTEPRPLAARDRLRLGSIVFTLTPAKAGAEPTQSSTDPPNPAA